MNIGNCEEIRDIDIAVVGMDCRFPGANTPEVFWKNICDGKEALTFYTDEELKKSGVPEELIKNPNYIKSSFALEDVDKFDASFFGFTPREAKCMDPQQRLLLETAWRALEDAGYSSDFYGGKIGAFIGVGTSHYLLKNIMSNYDLDTSDEIRTIWIGNDSNFASTMISYKLNLNGPSMTIQTSCSTSLTAIAAACQSLLNYQCDMALAGGCKVAIPQDVGYLYIEGEVLSPDGHCRPFDKDGKGTLGGSGVGVVVLKRLEDAVADKDNILAVVKGCALNNDGASKVGYSAPSVEGERKAIQEAYVLSEVDADTITYVETHGTATPLGDPIEIQALSEAFSGSTDRKQYCALGAVKANIGHLDAAAGVAGFIKTCLMLKHKMLPPSINYCEPNPNIHFGHSPFYVNTCLKEWMPDCRVRRAGVSSFGIGGTNVHVVLEEAEETREVHSHREAHLLTISGKTRKAVEQISEQLAAFMESNIAVDYRNVAYTMNVGRKSLPYRRTLVCSSKEECIEKLKEPSNATHCKGEWNNEIIFMFPGQGSQYVNMAKGLFETEEVFREEVLTCCELLKKQVGYDLKDWLFTDSEEEKCQKFLTETENTHVALFTIEYAMAKLLMHWGIKPKALIGHSIGEYVAACVAGVFSLEDALKLIAHRGKIMQAMPKGSMLSVNMGEEDAKQYINDKISLAVINTDHLVVLSGESDEIKALMEKLNGNREYRLLHTSHAFHSPMMRGGVEAMVKLLSGITFHKPKLPYMSNVTGDWIKPEEAVDVNYWIKHMLGTVNFRDGAKNLGKSGYKLFFEVGPGKTLSTFMQENIKEYPDCVLLQTIRAANHQASDTRVAAQMLGTAWANGIHVHFAVYHQKEEVTRVSLPTYPFESKSYWIHERKKNFESTTEENDGPEDTAEDNLEVHEEVVNRPDLSTKYIAPSNDLEVSIIKILEDLTGIKPIGVDDNFFELGGHSLMATQAIARIRELYSLDLQLKQFIEAPTVREISDAVIEMLSESVDLDELQGN